MKSQGESACLSLIGVKLHKDIFSPLKLHLSKRGIRNVFTQTGQWTALEEQVWERMEMIQTECKWQALNSENILDYVSRRT